MKEGGTRLITGPKKSLPNTPLISIVTVVFNGKQLLEKTIQSVLSQTYPNVEYVIIDGGSNDGTIETLSKYSDRIDYWLSEPDRGIYDAMNKGVTQATGDWVNFMNCGDQFASNDVLEMFANGGFEADIIFGDATVQYQNFETVFKKMPLHQMWRRIPFCHQASFTRLSLLKQWKFDLAYRLSSDFDFIYRAYLAGKTFKYVERVICLFDFKTGATINNAVKSIYERRTSVLTRNFSVGKWLYFNFSILYIYLATNLKKLLGPKLSSCITRLLKS